MSDQPESDIEDELVAYLTEKYGAENVDRQHHYDSDRVADIQVDAPLCVFAIEVESRMDHTWTGIGQMTHYRRAAQRETGRDSVGVVVVPDGHTESPEWDDFRASDAVLALEWPSDFLE